VANNSKPESFDIRAYSAFLGGKEGGYYACPHCQERSLSIKSDSPEYDCYGCHETKAIAFKLRELAGEFSGKKSGKLIALRGGGENSGTEKLKSMPAVLDFLAKNFEGKIKYNERSRQVELNGKPIEADTLRAWFAAEYRVDVANQTWVEGVTYLGKRNRYDPVKDYLEKCRPLTPVDVDTAFVEFFGDEAATDTLSLVYFSKWLIGCVARVYSPGCKFDECLTLVGPQGTLKSTFFRKLSNGYFSDSLTSKLDKDDIALLIKNWMLEFSELDAITYRTHTGLLKAFLSRTEDQFRAPYGREYLCEPRRSVVCGSTNSPDFLRDSTGSRRFWILEVKKEINIDKVEKLRDGLWAWAIGEYLAGTPWHLDHRTSALQAERNEGYEGTHPWVEMLEPWLETQQLGGVGHVSVSECFKRLEDQGVKMSRGQADARQVTEVLAKLGWHKNQKRLGQKREWGYQWRDPEPF
jgi:predicted P-loop ATPase